MNFSEFTFYTGKEVSVAAPSKLQHSLNYPASPQSSIFHSRDWGYSDSRAKTILGLFHNWEKTYELVILPPSHRHIAELTALNHQPLNHKPLTVVKTFSNGNKRRIQRCRLFPACMCLPIRSGLGIQNLNFYCFLFIIMGAESPYGNRWRPATT